ncbi:B-4DMT family transporter [Amycolatopsis antarctica]|uniref:B-4DMT family transporter n=1 Tax=Amycolatopsis antarctica TaxID=1854586 RepID=UPI00196BAE4B|nr:B-4DMT family transporter [Amycolatopsis antarctica]
MPSWLLRGFGLAVLHAAAEVALAKIAVQAPSDADVITALVIALLVGAAALWSALDGWLRRGDRGRTWFVAALLAGPVAGILGVIGRSLLVDQTGLRELLPALTGGAAFTALLVLVPAGLGLFVGGRLRAPAGRRDEDEPEPEDDRPTPAPAAVPGGFAGPAADRAGHGSGRRRPRPRAE